MVVYDGIAVWVVDFAEFVDSPNVYGSVGAARHR